MTTFHLTFKLMLASSLLSFSLGSVANAQLFGNRSIGAPAGSQVRSPIGTSNTGGRVAVPAFGSPTGQPPTGQPGASGAGLLDGNERFVRGNRSRQEFVGTGRDELAGFVGSGQAIGVGRVPAATDNFRLETINANRVNKPLPKQPAKGLYYPRLVIEDDDVATRDLPSSREDYSSTLNQLQKRVANVTGPSVQVIMGPTGTVVLRGSVDSKRTAELAANVLSFEPGVDRIDNQLTIERR